jgi:glutathione S-transferase
MEVTHPSLRLYSFHRCPYALRTRIVLKEKGLDYEHVEVDLKNKPTGFATISPYGTVPVLVDGAATIFESSVINEYLDERYPSPPLMPTSPEKRAHARFWIDFANALLFPAGKRVVAAKPETKGEARTAFKGLATRLDGELATQPFIVGEQFTLADAACIPVFARVLMEGFDWLALPRLEAWWQRVVTRPAFVATGGLRPVAAPI